MKRYFILLCLLLLVSGAQANTRLTFQNPNDFIAQISCIPGSGAACSWQHNTTGGNSYILHGVQYITASSPVAMQYAAASPEWVLPATFGITLLDAAGTQLVAGTTATTSGYSRVEVKMIGTSAYIYVNGVEQSHTIALAQNPSYIGWGIDVDDTIWGSSQPLVNNASDKYIFGMPESGFFLMKDFLTPAASGFYQVNQTDPNGTPTLISSFYLPSQFAKGGGDNETVVLNEYGGGNYQTVYTGTALRGSIYWNLTEFFATSAPYGLYVTTIPGSISYSDTIPYIGSGANIFFDKDQYAVGETATLSTLISDGYYDTAAYTYHVKIQDIFGTEVSDQPITFTSSSPHTGSVSYAWTDTDTNGVYYGMIYATRLSDSEDILMNYDTCELTSSLYINGYVKDAQTTLPISGATVNVSQGVTSDPVLSGVDGNYTSTLSTFSANALTTLAADMTGYDSYTTTFTPLSAGSIQINISLMPTTPTHTGIALGGLVVSPPYNRTVDSATVVISNSGVGSYTVTTNSAGFYIQDLMPNGTIWDIMSYKTGYSNSSIYQKLVVGI